MTAQKPCSLRELRLDRVLNQEELAQRAALSGRTILRLESGHVTRPHPGTLRKLAEALGEPVESVYAAYQESVRQAHAADPSDGEAA